MQDKIFFKSLTSLDYALDSRKSKLLMTKSKTSDFSISSHGCSQIVLKKVIILFLLEDPKNFMIKLVQFLVIK